MAAGIAETDEGLEIVVRRPRRLVDAVGIAIWFGVVAFVMSDAVLKGATDRGRVLVSVLFCAVAGAVVVHRLLRALVGRERIVVTPSVLRIRSEILGLGLRREYRIASVRRLRAVPPKSEDEPSAAIAFDHGSDDVRFGEGLGADEARSIVERMRMRAPFPP